MGRLRRDEDGYAAADAPRGGTRGRGGRDTDVAPASTAGRICLTDAPRGQICATYTVGEKPADVLTRQLNAQGLSVRSG